ncbi:MAG: nickel pincer cofactor biosynthesis protein LarC [candidate division Zixibacteria bacterium]|nr:nickel pincer cofactor biosynthesis protein LarC [candidate division Zixibacteria bacterium]
MKLLYLDGNAGASGDTLLSAFLDLTDGRKRLEEGLARLKLPGVQLAYPPRLRGGVEAVGVEVIVSAEAPHFDDVSAVEVLLARAPLSPYVKERAGRTFRKLAEAERRAHRAAVGRTTFHELGAVDAVVDVVGAFILLEIVKADRVVASPLRLGSGYVETAHGKLPVPAPATLELLRGVPAFGGGVSGEFTTPTGAALIATVADGFGQMPTMTIEAAGYGPGTADPPEFPNVLRAFLGETLPQAKAGLEGQVAVLEANVDDMTPEELSFAAQALLGAGALDVAVTPAVMKKGRPGHAVKIIGRLEDRERLCDLVLRYTSTLGVRYYEAARKILERRVVTVESEYGTGKVKLAVGAEGEMFPHAEYESAAELASRAGVAVREVARALEAAAARLAARAPDEKSAGKEPAPGDFD